MELLKNELNSLWAGLIEKFEVDMLKNTIFLNIKILDNNVETHFDLTFNDVSAHYFVKNNGLNRFEHFGTDEGDYLEITSIEYLEPKSVEININSSSNKWAEEYYSSANFVLEIWSSMLFIEARSVTLNENTFYTN